MKIIVDADSCPVKNIISEIGKTNNIRIIFVSNICHNIEEDENSRVITVDNYKQGADIEIFNISRSGDIVVTNDYGIAAVVLEKDCRCISPNGNIYQKNNIDNLLFSRFITIKQRRGGFKIKGPSKRCNDDDKRFRENLLALINRTPQ